MPAANLQSYKVATNEALSSSKQTSMVQAIETELNAVDNDNITGTAAIAATKLAAGAERSILRTSSGVPTWIDAFSTYVPVWTSSGTAPSLGNGTLTGRYFPVGKCIFAHITLLAGTTTTFGTGGWRFTLPVTPSNAYSTWGNGLYFDSSSGDFHRANLRADFTLQLALPYTNASPMVAVDVTNPFAWATGDSVDVSVWYEAL